MFSELEPEPARLLSGNILLILCCAFYLAWWLLDFHPTHAVKGFRSGWLLIPACLFGIAAVVEIVRGISQTGPDGTLFRMFVPAAAGIVLYLLLLIGTSVLLKRQVTTELMLIVGWTVLVFVEVNALYSFSCFAKGIAVTLLVVSVLAAAVSVICYLLYYQLDAVKGYIDGMIPLLLVAFITTAITIIAA